MSENKIVNATQIGTAFSKGLQNTEGFGAQTSVNLDANALSDALNTMGLSTGKQDGGDYAQKGIQDLASSFASVNNDSSIGIYQTDENTDYYVSGSTLNALAQIMIDQTASGTTHGQAILTALSNAYEGAEDHSKKAGLRPITLS